MHLIVDFLIFIVIDLISTGLFYITGCVLVPLFTFGHVVAGGWSNEENTSLDNESTNVKSKTKELGAWYVMVIGGVFWAIIAAAIWKF